MAFREMWNGRPGPVHVELPAPILYEERDDEDVRVIPPRGSRGTGPQAAEAQLDEAATILASAQHPVVISGTGVDRARANDALLEIVGLLGAPVLTTMAGRSSVPTDHPNCVFGFGPAGDQVRREADVLLVIGSRMGNLDVPYDEHWGDPDRQRLVQIDIDPRNLGVTRPLSLGIVADARTALEGIATRLRSMTLPARDGEDLARYRELDEETRMAQAGPILEWQGPGIHPAHAAGVIGAVFGPEAVYTVDGGNTSLWAYSALPPTQPCSYHSILELGMLGTGIPQAIGAKLGAPDREVVCITGDGAAGFNVMEMQSAAREGLAITTIVFAEGSWTMEEPNELDLYGQTFGTAQGTIRWDLVGRGSRLPRRARRSNRGSRAGAAPRPRPQRSEPRLPPHRPRCEPRGARRHDGAILRGLLRPGRGRAGDLGAIQPRLSRSEEATLLWCRRTVCRRLPDASARVRTPHLAGFCGRIGGNDSTWVGAPVTKRRACANGCR